MVIWYMERTSLYSSTVDSPVPMVFVLRSRPRPRSTGPESSLFASRLASLWRPQRLRQPRRAKPAIYQMVRLRYLDRCPGMGVLGTYPYCTSHMLHRQQLQCVVARAGRRSLLLCWLSEERLVLGSRPTGNPLNEASSSLSLSSSLLLLTLLTFFLLLPSHFFLSLPLSSSSLSTLLSFYPLLFLPLHLSISTSPSLHSLPSAPISNHPVGENCTLISPLCIHHSPSPSRACPPTRSSTIPASFSSTFQNACSRYPTVGLGVGRLAAAFQARHCRPQCLRPDIDGQRDRGDDCLLQQWETPPIVPGGTSRKLLPLSHSLIYSPSLLGES